MINQKPADYQEKKTRLELENQLEELLAGAAKLADSSCTRDNTRDRLIDECKNVKQALQNLMDEYMKHVIIRQNFSLFRIGYLGVLNFMVYYNSRVLEFADFEFAHQSFLFSRNLKFIYTRCA